MLDKILSQKRKEFQNVDFQSEIEKMKKRLSGLAPTRSFTQSLTLNKDISLIAEIKRSSPSQGPLVRDLDVEKTARVYEKAGASAISVLTENQFFDGSIEDLQKAKHCTQLPVLRKDFILEEFQVWESRFLGTDAILLIAGILSSEELNRFHSLAQQIGLEVLIEAHTEKELRKVLQINPGMVGINNRNLESFEVDLKVTEKLKPLIPPEVICVSESGIKTREDVKRLQDIGVDAVLVGEVIVRCSNPYLKIRELLGKIP